MKELMLKLRKIRSVGINPVNWCFELIALYISRTKEKSKLNALLEARKVTSASLTLSTFASSEEIRQVLQTYGVCIIEDFVPRDLAIEAGGLVEKYYDDEIKRREKILNTIGYEEGEQVWQTDYAWTDSYLKMAGSDRAVVNIRSQKDGVDDSGMVDIFGIEKIATALGWTELCSLVETIEASHIKKVIQRVARYPQRHWNLYLNRSVVQTRGPHIDNNDSPYKMFVYLSDVVEEGSGPYCYLPKSHVRRKWMSYERLRNAVLNFPSTEVSSVDRNQLTKLMGKAGTAIITCQSGIHCGWPQEKEGRRLALVANFY